MNFKDVFNIKADLAGDIPLTISLMETKDSPPTILRVESGEKNGFEIVVKPFFKPITKMYDEKKQKTL